MAADTHPGGTLPVMLYYLLYGSGRALAFTVHESPSPPADRIDRAEALRFIKDGFNVQAAIGAPLWLASRRLWWPLALYACGAAALYLGHIWFGAGTIVPVVGLAVMHILAGFEADAFERADLERKGWATLGAVTGTSSLDCERRFLDEWLPRQPIITAGSNLTASPPAPQPAAAVRPQLTSARSAQSAAGRLAALWRPKS